MEAFGSTDWPEPLMPIDQQTNGPKSNLMNLQAPMGLNTIRDLARRAAASGNQQDTDNLLQAVRIVSLSSQEASISHQHSVFFPLTQFAGFRHLRVLNNNNFASCFNLVHNQV